MGPTLVPTSRENGGFTITDGDFTLGECSTFGHRERHEGTLSTTKSRNARTFAGGKCLDGWYA
jgi:hypothetical protein